MSKEVLSVSEFQILVQFLNSSEEQYHHQNYLLQSMQNQDKLAKAFVALLMNAEYARKYVQLNKSSQNIFETMCLTVASLIILDKDNQLHDCFLNPELETVATIEKFLENFESLLSKEFYESLLSILCSLCSYRALSEDTPSNKAHATNTLSKVLQLSRKSYRFAKDNADYIGKKRQLSTLCEHYCVSRLLDVYECKMQFIPFVKVFVEDYKDVTDGFRDDVQFYFCIVVFKLTFVPKAVKALEKLDLSNVLYRILVTNTNERILMANFMVIESIFEKRLKNLVFQFFQTDLFRITGQLARKSYKDKDIEAAIANVNHQMGLYFQEYNSFDRWKYEVDSKCLRQSSIHEKKFLQEHIKALESSNFLYVRKLIEIVNEELTHTERGEQVDVENLIVALNDLSTFVENYNNPKIVLDYFSSRDKLYSCMNHPNNRVKKAGLVFTQKLLIRK